VGILQLDNITRGTWKPHFLEGDLFGGMFKLDNCNVTEIIKEYSNYMCMCVSREI